ncbi:hypothetical protein IT570_04785 [Candidatus Sumerlaeota bacterium]|nr:hypothetical protein [Candidatus Sumerlaeota bacterium]
MLARPDSRALWLIPGAAALVLCACALQALSYPLSWAALVCAWVACFTLPVGLPSLRPSRPILIAALIVLPLWWFADSDSPHQWDAVQTAIRADLFWQTGTLERASLFYPVISPFVVLFRHTTVPSHLLVMMLGVGTIAAATILTSRLAGKTWAFRVAIIAPLLPPIFLLYRWVMLDTLLVMLWMLTLLAVVAWGRCLTPARIAIIILLVVLTVTAKEMGVLIVFPVLGALIAFARRRQLPLRLAVAGFLVVTATVISVIILQRYAHLKGITNYFQDIVYSDQGLTFLPALKGKAPEALRFYLISIIRMNLSFWVQAGFMIPLTFALFRPARPTSARLLLISGGAVQLAWLLVSRPDRWGDIFTYPVFDGSMTSRSFLVIILYLLAVFSHWVGGDLKLAINRKTLVLLLAILPGAALLHCFVKAYNDGETLHVWVAWHYLVVLLASAIPLAALGLRRISRMEMPHALRLFLLFVASVTIMNALLHGFGMALNFRILNMARLDAYQWMESQPERVVYTHWPFISADDKTDDFDNGPLAWQSDGWKVSGLYQFDSESVTPSEDSLFLYGTYRGYGLPTKRFPRLADPAYIGRVDRWRPGLLNFRMENESIEAIVVRRFPSEHFLQEKATSVVPSSH